MDKGTQTMIDNMKKNTGKTLEDWIDTVSKQGLEKHGDIISFLKEQHALTHGFANLIAHKAKGSDAGSAENQDDLITKQYLGKEHFQPLYEKLITEIRKFGNDIEIAPKNAYVSVRRKNSSPCCSPLPKHGLRSELTLKGRNPKVNWNPSKRQMPCVLTKSVLAHLKILTRK